MRSEEVLIERGASPHNALSMFMRKEPDDSLDVLRVLLQSKRAVPNECLDCILLRDRADALQILLSDHRTDLSRVDINTLGPACKELLLSREESILR